MLRRLAVVAAFALAACGNESSSPSQPNAPGWQGGGSISTAALLKADTTLMKVVLNTTKSVDTPITVYDGASDTDVPVTCTTTANCSAYPGASCKNGQCIMTSYVNAIFYVDNYPATQPSIPLPCDGKTYTVEVYGAKNAPSAGAPLPINEAWVSPPVSIAAAACGSLSVTWTPQTLPALVVPTIYVGFGPPYDNYTVKVTGLTYPWESSNWSLTYAGQDPKNNPTKYSGANATFLSPTSTSALTFTGLFHLRSSILLAGESATSWELTVAPDAQNPVGAGSINLP